MRISFTGAAGIGKTTLANALARELELPVIEENLREVVQAFNLSPSALPPRERITICRKVCLDWLANRAQLYQKHPHFVEDRCAIDILFRWLTGNLSDRDNAETSQVLGQTKQLLDQIDYLVILPLTLTTRQENEAGLTRIGSLSRLLRAQALAIGIAHQLMDPTKLVFIPCNRQTIEARIKFVLERIQG